jgi:hypothetical protein
VKWTVGLAKPRWILALAVGLVAAGVAGLVAAHGGNPTLLHGCVSTSSNPRGQLTIYSLPGQSGPSNGLAGPTGTCGALGSSLDWGTAGAQGPSGGAGPSGAAGGIGPTGASGPSGPGANTLIGGTLRNIDVGTSAASYSTIFGGTATSGDQSELTMPSAGTVRNLQVRLKNAIGGNGHLRVDLLKNGTTALGCTITSGQLTCQNTNPANVVTFTTADTIAFQTFVFSGFGTTPTDVHWAATFIPS